MINTILEFQGAWRNYQQRVLDNFDRYQSDKKIHIVAAPGSGKTTLGIELIKRLDRNALVLVPSITIRTQWYDRIVEAFLKEGYEANDYLSQDLKKPGNITIATYQALHSAMTHYTGQLTDGEDGMFEEANYHDFSLIDTLKEYHVHTLCLDECHHLRSEWWKSLETLKKELSQLYTISLTATPPYDDNLTNWNKYMDMCGEIDEEITIPELVKQGTLCPHQDYVYFNYPTHVEQQQLAQYLRRGQSLQNELVNDVLFQDIIKTHRFFRNDTTEDILLENPAYLSSMLIYLKETGIEVQRFQKLLGYQELEPLSLKWMEILLQGFLYDDVSSYRMDEQYHQNLIKHMKSLGLIEKKKVSLVANEKVEKLLMNSIGKLEGIQEICFHEYNHLKSKLRLLILTDYIRKEFEKNIGDETVQIQSIGVLPIFELLRRQHIAGLKCGVLCGGIVIIPYEARHELLHLVGQNKVSFHALGSLDDYLRVDAIGDDHLLIKAVSQLFEKGYIHVLIGTKSLLGEGWDCPSVNTLILASFVGSFMLSNQMRGRAIRIDRNNPHKCSHIWHLVCLKPKINHWQDEQEESQDFQTLQRRMDHFLGLHYQENIIENGIERLSVISLPFTPNKVKKINKEMLQLSKQRDHLYQRWQEALLAHDQIEIVDEAQMKPEMITAVLLYDKLRALLLLIVALGLGCLALVAAIALGQIYLIVVIVYLTLLLICFIFSVRTFINYKNPLKRLEKFGDGLLKSLRQMQHLESTDCVVQCEQTGVFYGIYLKGGTGHDKALFAKCVYEFYDCLDNQRYILYNPKRKKKSDGYFVVPEIFSKRKEEAVYFASMMKPYLGQYEAIYTRSEQGRKILLSGRKYALSNREERCITRKKVKGALE